MNKKKLCIKCNVEKKLNSNNFYFYKNGKPRNECKRCIKLRTYNYKKNKRKLGIPYYTSEQNAKRRYKRLINKNNNIKISFAEFLEIEEHNKKISFYKNKLNNLEKKLKNKNPKKNILNYYRILYKINDAEWNALIKDNPKKPTLLHRIKYKYDKSFVLKVRLKNQLIKKQKKYPNIDIQLRNYIKNNTKNNMYEVLLGYSTVDLKNHLESNFTEGMNWNEFIKGNIHIDHIKPQSLFNLNKIEQIKKCWSLDNLQPLWAKDNLKKSNKYKNVNK